MALLQREDKHFGNAETVIGPSVKVEGNFSGEGDVLVDGVVVGTIKTAKNLRVGPGAKIQADVEAENIMLAGEIRGNVLSRGKLEMTSSAKIIGNVRASLLTVAEGAILHGKCSMQNGKDADMSADTGSGERGDDHAAAKLKR